MEYNSSKINTIPALKEIASAGDAFSTEAQKGLVTKS